MGQKDKKINTYLADPVRCADLLNNGLFCGMAVIDPAKLVEKDGASRGNGSWQKRRDIKKQYENEAIFMIVGVENQTHIHYAMPLRCLDYDTRSYEEQRLEIQKRHEKEKDLQEEEWLSRFAKADKLIPTITLVVYYGTKPWDASLDLHGMLAISDQMKEYQPMMLNYKINLLEVAKIENLDSYGDDLKRVFGFVKYQEDKEALKRFVEENQALFESVPRETCETIEVMADAKEIREYMEKDKEEEVNVCKALQGIREDGRAEGEVRKVIQLVYKKVQKNQDCETIAAAVEENTDFVQSIIDAIGNDVDGYSEDEVYRKIS